MPDRVEMDADPRILTEAEIADENDADEADRREEADQRWADAVPPSEEAFEWPEVSLERVKHFVIDRDGKQYVLYAGLLDLLHQASAGHFEVKTSLEQRPGTDNAQTAIVTATVAILDPADAFKPLRSASGIGDAYPGNVSKAMAPHTIRMAETRAIARSLRVLLNVGMTAFEELGAGGGQDAAPAGAGRPAARPTPEAALGDSQRIQVDGAWFSRDQVWEAYGRRMGQMREAGLEIPRGSALVKTAPLKEIAGVTQSLKKILAENGKLPPARAS